MSIAVRLPILALVMAVAACSSVQQARSTVDLPGEAPKRPGLQVPPDAWAHPAAQTASAATPR